MKSDRESPTRGSISLHFETFAEWQQFARVLQKLLRKQMLRALNTTITIMPMNLPRFPNKSMIEELLAENPALKIRSRSLLDRLFPALMFSLG